jgi:predicted type IV restriction endonuclease
MGLVPDTIKRLVDRFNQQSDTIRLPDYNETLIRIDFINPLMRELGWDIDNHAGYAEQYREVVHEDRVKVAGQTKAPDYSFRIGGQRKFFLEAKKPAVNIKDNWEPAYQLRRYAWSAKLACSLLTDFEEFAVYDARLQPKQLEKASIGRRDELGLPR